MDNSRIARLFNEVADLLDIRGENPFRVRSYRTAARTVEDHPEDLAAVLRDGGDLTALPGIGKDLAAKIAEIIETGRLGFLDELKAKLPPGLPELLRLEGVGPKKVKLFFEEAGVDSIENLDRAAREGRLRGLDRMGEKSEAGIIRAIENYRKHIGRFRLDDGLAAGAKILDSLKPVADRVVAAGSLRRRRETIGDLDILAVSSDPSALTDRFVNLPGTASVPARGPTRSSIRLEGGLQVDLRVMEGDEFGSALLYFTGSQAHNIALRRRAREMGLKVSEYGIFRGEEKVAGETEEDCYRALDLPWIPPELRENRGEIEAAKNGRLPRLIELEAIRGDLQSHSTASDGKESIMEMGRAAGKRGYGYIAITDHSRAVRVAGGLDEKQLALHLEEIERSGEKCPGVRILKGVEVDILADGTLDLADAILRECEVVVASIHSSFRLPRKEMTRRIVRALTNPHVNILGHPTGRMLLRREPCDFDFEEVVKAAVGEGVSLEINGHPARLDLNDVLARRARELGARLAVNTDAHSSAQLDLMTYGVFTARRAWLEDRDVINTLPLEELLAALNRPTR